MTKLVAQNAQWVIDGIVREEWGRVKSALMSVCRDFDVAEDALQDAVITDERLTLIFTSCHPYLHLLPPVSSPPATRPCPLMPRSH